MLRSRVPSAVEADVYALRDDGAAMASALHRLAALRATLHRDWSDGPASLVLIANEERPARHDHRLMRARAWEAPDLTFTLDPAFSAELAAPAPELRGRFDCLEEMPPPEISIEEEAPPELHVGAGAPVGWLLDLVHIAPEPGKKAAETAPEADVDDGPLFAAGAIAGIAAWDVAAPPAPTPVAPQLAAPGEEGAPEHQPLGAGAFANILAWLDAPTATIRLPPAPTPVVSMDDDEDVLLVGAVIDCLALDAPTLDVARTPPESRLIVIDDADPCEAAGAIADIVRLLDLTPPPEAVMPPPVVDLDVAAFGDGLADVSEALYAAAFDPSELYAWGASALPGEAATAEALAACEAALWNLPRTMTCAEVFALNPNHETAVRITRALRVRADTLQARAFTATTGFGALRTGEAFLPWFPSVEKPLEPGSDTLDADTAFATWDAEETAPRVTAPDRPRPILSEEELDALLATPAAQDSHELDDAWQESPVWRETFWHGVDAYLQTVEDCEFRQEAMKDAPEAPAHPDIEIRDEVAAPEAAMHFWRPGDETDLALDGDGSDLFLIGGDTTGVVLVEDGAMHAMRTGRGTRVGEVVVSWSDDLWADPDGLGWTRVATLSGISDLRVEQTAARDRAVIVSGELSGTALKADRVCLVQPTEDGPISFPVRHVGGFADGVLEDWPIADMPGAGDAARLFI